MTQLSNTSAMHLLDLLARGEPDTWRNGYLRIDAADEFPEPHMEQPIKRHPTHQLEKGRALIIIGPEGSGKSTLARTIAAAHGRFVEIDASQLREPFGFAALASGDVKTVIVEGLQHTLADLKSLITNPHTFVESKGREPRTVPTPNFIFCTYPEDPFVSAGIDERRFTEIRLPALTIERRVAVTSEGVRFGDCMTEPRTWRKNMPDQIAPIDMVLHCPACGVQHIDSSETNNRMHAPGCNLSCGMLAQGCNCNFSKLWTNPPHRSHLCHNCGHIWRPADVATNGVQAVKTEGKKDSPVVDGHIERGVLVDGHFISCAWMKKWLNLPE